MTESQSKILTFAVMLVGFFIIRELINLHFSYQQRRLDYSGSFCMAVIHGANYNEAHTQAALEFSHKYHDFVKSMESEKVRKDFLDFIKTKYNTYYLVSRARLPEDDPLWIPRTSIPNHHLYFL